MAIATPTPQSFGDYVLHDTLGRGGMGIVYKAQERTSGRWVALKLGPPESQLSGARAERFRREGQIAASLRHPNLLQIHAAGVVDGQPYLALELVSGCRTLREVCTTASLRERVRAVRDVARGLGHAHAH